MNPEEQRIKIAEWCGWKWGTPMFQHDGKWHSSPYSDGFEIEIDSAWAGEPHDVIKDVWMLPDYLNDMNAIHEAVSRLNDRHKFTDDTRSMFYDYLALGSDGFPDKWEICWHCTTATAAQRAEALLRTIAKWTDPIPASWSLEGC